MNNIKKLLYAVIFALTIVLCTGCLTAHHSVNITSDGGSITKDLTMAKSTFDSLVEMGLSTEDLTAEGGTISYYTEDEVDYVKFSMTETYTSISELESALKNTGTEGDEDLGEDSTSYFDAFLLQYVDNEKFVITGRFSTIEDIGSLYTKCTLSFTLPYKITSFNIGNKTDDYTITINMLKSWEAGAEKNFEIVAEKGSNMPSVVMITILGIGIAILAGLTIFTISLIAVKNKQRQSTTSEASFTEVVDSQIEEPEDFYVDSNGNTYYLDDNGTPYYLDSNGNPFYLDSNGTPYYIDSEGHPFYLDTEGRPFYVDKEGRIFYVDEYGQAIYVDQDGRPFIIDEDGNAYYVEED